MNKFGLFANEGFAGHELGGTCKNIFLDDSFIRTISVNVMAIEGQHLRIVAYGIINEG